MVNLHASDLLRRLSSGVRPDGEAPPCAGAPIESRGFAELLASARKGELRSDRPLSLSRGVEGALTEPQLDRLALAADAAEAEGAQRLLAIIDGKAVNIDIASRTVRSVEPSSAGRLMGDADSFVILPAEESADMSGLFSRGSAAPGKTPRGAAGAPVRNASMAALLAAADPSRGGVRDAAP